MYIGELDGIIEAYGVEAGAVAALDMLSDPALQDSFFAKYEEYLNTMEGSVLDGAMWELIYEIERSM